MIDVSIMIDLDQDGTPVGHEIVTYDEAQSFTASPGQYAAFMAGHRAEFVDNWQTPSGSRSLYKVAVKAARVCEFCGDPAPEGWIADGRPSCPPCNSAWLNGEYYLTHDQLAEDWQTYAEEIRIR